MLGIKLIQRILKLLCVIILCLIFNFKDVYPQKNAGIFYSTLFAKDGVLKRIDSFADKADYIFLEDVNGDGYDDAIAIYGSAPEPGGVFLALSNGSKFLEPELVFKYHYQVDFVYPLMGDVNGDGKKDIIYVDKYLQKLSIVLSKGKSFEEPVNIQLNLKEGELNEAYLADLNGDNKDDLIFFVPSGKQEGRWYACLANETGFKKAVLIMDEPGLRSVKHLLGDVNGDGCVDLLSFRDDTWRLSLSDAEKFLKSGICLNKPENVDSETIQILYDVDKDGKDDLVFWNIKNDCNWLVAYSRGENFEPPVVYIINHLHAGYKGNVTSPEYGFIGTLDGKTSVSMIVTRGKWLGVDFQGRNTIAHPLEIDSWEAWGHDLIPEGGTYNTGDSAVNDKHIKMIRDAGFTYVTMDITNGNAEWVNSRAKKFMKSLDDSNKSLASSDEKLFVNIALGKTRGIEGEDAFFIKLNQECKKAWDEFYLPYKDSYYQLDGKPLLIHMITTGLEFVDNLDNWDGDRKYIDRFTNRWMSGIQEGACEGRANYYGWIVPGENQIHKEMMPLMPGFKNTQTFYPRENGELYRKHWMRVIKYQPNSIWLNSFNDVEYTGIEPSYHVIDQFVAHPEFVVWTDYFGNRMDDFYWVMTKQYLKLYMENSFCQGTFFEIENDPKKTIYKVNINGFSEYNNLPEMAPVLLLPEDFIKNFKGSITPLKTQ